jgi:ribonuclease HI
MIIAHADGGFNKKGGYGSFLLSNEGIIRRVSYPFLCTNNETEYAIILNCLGYLVKHYPEEKYTIYSDSQLVINQTKGVWQVHSYNLLGYSILLRGLVKRFDVFLLWSPRERMVALLGH